MQINLFLRRAGRASAALALCGMAMDPAGAQGLPAEVDAALQRAQVPRDALVVSVQEVGRAAPRLSWLAERPVKPASLMKLVTTAAALELLGPAWSWSTPVWLQGPVNNGVLEGDLIIKGSGDPKLVMERVWLLLRRVQQLGVREIRGDIVLDRSAFAPPRQDPADFDGETSRPYNVLADALMLNYKAVVFTFTPDPARGVAVVSTEPPLAGVRLPASVPLLGGTCGDWHTALKAELGDPLRVRFLGGYAAACGERQWPVAYADPATYNGRALAGLWLEMGGRLGGRARDGAAPVSPPTFEVRSPGLAEVVRDINKFSNNVMAQQLYLTLGLTQRGSGTSEAAHEVVQQWLAERHGDAAAGTVIENGSGLSRGSRASAQLLSRLLQSTWSSPVMPELMSSLPASGLDGTLRRARGAPAGRAHLKTGSLRDVTGIAGYVLANSGRRYVVVAIVNHPNAPAARPVLDAVVQWAVADVPAPLPLVPPQAAATGVPRLPQR
jgi:D-alanyl-D-alanine carboxypeptidase/D-alanyl-D-alanine-endopeptidase (penicillin-binding protein 4)